MKILHTVQGYYPTIGGSEELVRKISEEMVRLGHEVTVFTSSHPARTFTELNGVKIRQFGLSGSQVRGIKGEARAYTDAVQQGTFDLMMNYAAQTWATDLLLPLLETIPYRKILAPCGYSGLHSRQHSVYYRTLPERLRLYDHLIYHSSCYQDKLFGDRHHLDRYSVIPNFADAAEFTCVSTDFRTRYGIDRPLMLLTVANHYRDKGHHFVLDAFLEADVKESELVVIGNPTTPWKVYSDCYYACRIRERLHPGRVRMLSHVPRTDVIAAYQQADLFLFGSKVECSPLVIFEAMASGTPWISTNVGNLAEIQHGDLVATSGEMARRIRAYADDPMLRKNRGLDVQREWHEKYELKTIVQRYLNVYQSVIASSR